MRSIEGSEDREWRGGHLLAEGTIYVNSGTAVSALDLGGGA
ncbi:hypothetical protein [Streptomyces sp. V1I1]|nr:hypothetical protein [Streptomyces sp. V1I1]